MTQRQPTSPSRPRGRPRADKRTAQRREEILDAATRFFARDGFARTDVQQIADALSLGKGTVYRYFPSKSALFLAAVDRGMQRLTERLDAVMGAATDLMDMVGLAIETYLAYFAENPDLVELLVQERAEFRDRQTPTYFLYHEKNISCWEEVVRALIREGRIRNVPAERVSQVVGDMLYGAMFTNYFARRHISPAQQAADIFDIAFRGLLTDRERERHHA